MDIDRIATNVSYGPRADVADERRKELRVAPRNEILTQLKHASEKKLLYGKRARSTRAVRPGDGGLRNRGCARSQNATDPQTPHWILRLACAFFASREPREATL